jgi:hypothetical protein
MSQRTAERLAVRADGSRRADEARQLAADGYVAALEGVSWLHPDNIEDSVLEPWVHSYEPRFRFSIDRLRDARTGLHKAAALSQPGPLREAASEAARLAGVLANAWESAREYADRYHNPSKPGAKNKWFSDAMMKEYSRVEDARRSLTGLEVDRQKDEIDLGMIAESGVLGRLRDAIWRYGIEGVPPN